MAYISIKTLPHCFRSTNFEIKSYLWDLKDNFSDVFISCNDGKHKIPAHKIILAASSPLFANLLAQSPTTEEICLDSLTKSEVEDILQFVYKGEICLKPERFESFFSVAKGLSIRGMPALKIKISKFQTNINPGKLL